MGRRRTRRKKQRGGPRPEAQAADDARAAPNPDGDAPAPDGDAPAPDGDAAPAIVPWRTQMTAVRAALRDWSRLRYAEALDAWLRERFEDPDRPELAADVEQAIDDFVCSPGSSGDEPSILAVWCGQVANGQLDPAEVADLDPDAVVQARRWERERRRGVFLLQRAQRDQLALWDPLEGAPLTLHLLTRLGENEVGTLGRGAVVTAVYQPWVARLVAVGTEYFTDPRAIQLFREQTLEAERAWHEPPAPAPVPTKKRTGART